MIGSVTRDPKEYLLSTSVSKYVSMLPISSHSKVEQRTKFGRTI